MELNPKYQEEVKVRNKFMTLSPHEKSDVERNLGNEDFRQNRNYSALAHYNKAIIFGRDDKERIALCYANRSAVYLEMKHFKHCMQNIDMAEPNYPKEKIQKLHDRRQKCLKMMEDCADKTVEPFDHTFKLSHEPNPKIPFFIDAIEHKRNAKFGRHLITTRDLKAGDVIAVIDEPWQDSNANIFETAQLAVGCYNCMKFNNLNLIAGNCPVLFCNEECKKQHELNVDHEMFHEMDEVAMPRRFLVTAKLFMMLHDAFENFEDMKNFVEAHSGRKFSVFDFDWNLPNHDPAYIKNLLLIVKSTNNSGNDELDDDTAKLVANHIWDNFIQVIRCLEPSNRFRMIILENQIAHKKFLKKLMWHIWDFYDTRVELTFDLNDRNKIGAFIHPAMATLNHSCDPNIFIIANRSKEIVWIANQPIAAGSQLFCAYGAYPKFFFDSKAGKQTPCQKVLNCKPCRENWTSRMDEQKIYRDADLNSERFIRSREDAESVAQMLKYLQDCFDDMNKNFKSGYHKNAELLHNIAMKKHEIFKILRMLGNPYPPQNKFYWIASKTAGDAFKILYDGFGHCNEELREGFGF